MRKKLPKISSRVVFISVVFITLIVLLFPLLLRSAQGNENLIGPESYEQLRTSSLVFQRFSRDPLTGATMGFNLFSYLVAGLLYIVPSLFVAKLLPALLGVCSGVLFAVVLQKLGFTQAQRIFSLLLFLTSAVFIYLYATLTPFSLVILLLLAAAALYLSKKHYIAGLFLGLVVLVDLLSFLIALLLFFLHSLRDRSYDSLGKSYATAGAVLAAAALVFSMVPRFSLDLAAPSFKTIFVNFGATLGVGVPLFLLFAISFAANWKKAGLLAAGTVLALIALSFSDSTFTVFLNLFLVVYAGVHLDQLWQRQWELRNLKSLTLLLIICTLLFSSLSYINRLSVSPPSEKLSAALQRVRSSEQGVVLSHYSYNPYISYFAEAGVVWNSSRLPDELSADLQELFWSRDLLLTESLLQKHSVTDIFVTKEMMDGLVWEKDGQGLLFLLPNSQRFRKLYQYDSGQERYEVWQYVPSEPTT